MKKPSYQELEARIEELEDALQHSKTKKSLAIHKALLNSVTDSLSYVNVEYSYELVNEARVRYTGQAVADLVGEKVERFFDKTLYETKLKKYLERCFSGETIQFREWFPLPDGTRIYMDVSYYPVFSEDDNEVRGACVISRDRTEQKLAEERLRQSEEQFRALFHSTNDCIFLKDRDLRYTKINQAMARLFGKPVEELRGRSDRDLFGDQAANHIEEVDRRVLTGETIDEEDTKPVDGRLVTFHVKKTPVRTDDGSIIGLCGIARDITEAKRMEEELRTTSKMEAIGTLAGGVAHEFNNMLSIILGNTELAGDYIHDLHPAFESLEEIRVASLRARDVIQRLQRFAQKRSIAKKPIELRTIIEDTIALLTRTMPSFIDIRTDLRCRSQMVPANTNDMQQVLLNLCNNAMSAIGNGPGTIGITLEPTRLKGKESFFDTVLPPGDYLKLTCTDSGCGMDARTLEHVFDPYFTTKDVDEGMGMGLAVVHGIIKGHDGGINIASSEGQGTTVTILLPLCRQPSGVAGQSKHIRKTEKNAHILLVDDEDAVIRIFTKRLSSLGYRVTAAVKPEEALTLFRQNPKSFDLVITDLTMPQMSGTLLAEKIKEVRPNIPVVVCSGHHSGDNSDVDKHKSCIDGYIAKPISKQELAEAIGKLLQRPPTKR